MDVVVALPHTSRRARAAAKGQADVAEDAVIKAAPARAAKVKAPAKAKAKTTKAPKTSKPVTLTSNDNKVLDYLKTVLKADEWIAVTGAAVAQGAAMPLGSVGISLKKVVQAGAVKKKGKNSYQLLG
jgi:hypothetical protein